MITEEKLVDTILEQQISWIDNKIECNNWYPKMHKIMYGRVLSWRYSDIKESNQKKFKNKPLHQILHEAYNDIL